MNNSFFCFSFLGHLWHQNHGHQTPIIHFEHWTRFEDQMPHDTITMKLLHGDGELFLTNLLKDENMRYHRTSQMYPILCGGRC
jgi:hypothetical protein